MPWSKSSIQFNYNHVGQFTYKLQEEIKLSIT
jgi:hypothetical protein